MERFLTSDSIVYGWGFRTTAKDMLNNYRLGGRTDREYKEKRRKEAAESRPINRGASNGIQEPKKPQSNGRSIFDIIELLLTVDPGANDWEQEEEEKDDFLY